MPEAEAVRQGEKLSLLKRLNAIVRAEIETAIGVSLPDDLRGLLLESDAVDDTMTYEKDGVSETFVYQRLIFDADETLKTNVSFRSEFGEIYMPFDHFLFFGVAGNGDLYAFPIVNNEPKADIFIWNHETDSREWIAPNLRIFFEWWAAGKIPR